MKIEYPTEYTDKKGTEKSAFITDGKSMTITLRGITFSGHFCELTPMKGQEEKASRLFDLNEFGELSAIQDLTLSGKPSVYSLRVQIPIKVISHENQEMDGLIDFSSEHMNFILNGKTYPFEKQNFEYGLSLEFTKSLPVKYVKCCINCKFSAYWPYGNNEYGDMLCFKKCKEAWATIGYVGLKDSDNFEKVRERTTTQEAFWCDEFSLLD